VAEKYPNRSDLRNPAQKVAKMAATGQAYGEAGKQLAAQSAVPMGGSPMEAAPPPPMPGQAGGLDRMTERPDEPLTAGMSFGAGPGTEALAAPSGGPGSKEDLIMQLRLATARFPNPNLIQLLLMLEAQ
jgi:hypothetical protein